MLIGIVRSTASFFILLSALYIPFVLLSKNALSWNVTFVGFFANLILFTICWCSGVILPVKYAVLSALVGRIGFYVYESKIEVDWRMQSIALLVIAAFVFLTKSKLVSNRFNTFKCVLVDWLLLVPFFPICGFVDIYFETDTFFYVLGYFVGANLVGLATVYISSLVWNNIAIQAVSADSSPTSTIVLPRSSSASSSSSLSATETLSPADEQQSQVQEDSSLSKRKKSVKKESETGAPLKDSEVLVRTPKNVVTLTHSPHEIMHFVHLYTITRGTHALVGFTELLVCVWTFAFFLVVRMNIEGWVFGSVASWQLSFAFGVLSTITSYFGVISSGAALSPEELEYVKDIVPKSNQQATVEGKEA